MNSKILSMLALPVVLAACAGPMPADPDNMAEEKVYVTGSNLPQRNNGANVGTMSKEEFESKRNSQGMSSSVPVR